MTLKDKVDFIYENMPGTLADIAMMVPCHLNTLKKIKSGDEQVREAIRDKINELYERAVKVRAIVNGDSPKHQVEVSLANKVTLEEMSIDQCRSVDSVIDMLLYRYATEKDAIHIALDRAFDMQSSGCKDYEEIYESAAKSARASELMIDSQRFKG